MTDSVRLAKRVAELRNCSRREAEQYITGGWVRVDGIVVETPQFRITDQRIEIDAQADPRQAEPVTLLFHKPAGLSTAPSGQGLLSPAPGLLTATTRWAEDPSGITPLKKHLVQLSLCLPLDTTASGLIVFTQDWRIVRKLTEDAAALEHEILVDVADERPDDALECMARATALKVSWQSENRLRIALKGAQPGQIDRLCTTAGLQIRSVKRIRLGGVSMGKLPAGQWRYLREQERF